MRREKRKKEKEGTNLEDKYNEIKENESKEIKQNCMQERL